MDKSASKIVWHIHSITLYAVLSISREIKDLVIQLQYENITFFKTSTTLDKMEIGLEL